MALGTAKDFTGQRLQVEGSHCGGCVKKIEQALCTVSGVVQANMDLATGIAVVFGDVDANDLIEALKRAGYTATRAHRNQRMSS